MTNGTDCKHLGSSYAGQEKHTSVCASCKTEFCYWVPRAVVPVETFRELYYRIGRQWGDMVADSRYVYYRRKLGQSEPPSELERLEYMAKRVAEFGKWNHWHPEDVSRALAGLAFGARH